MPYHGNSIACKLSYGNEGDGVIALQTQINMCYYTYNKNRYIGTKLAVDGDFGTKTRDALKIVQGKAGASPDGAYGSETRGKMLWGVYFNGDPEDVVCHKLTEWDAL